ncbi:MAG TPA: metallophosphoesterase family protein [Burkholderiales bacterium]|nr:metallophosphoesterase family protein [Burkholderiales bacterium]
MATREYRVGLISDTHGLLRPQATAALAGSDFIIHAGDIGAPQVLEELARIAPVTAVRGNNDQVPWAAHLRDTEVLRVGEVDIYVIHDVAEMGIEPAGRFQAVIAGHSHKPGQGLCDEVLHVNPGSAGPRRFKLPVSVGRLRICGTRIEAELLTLEV